MNWSENRVDPSELTVKELDELEPILELADQNKTPILKGPDGIEYKLPLPIFEILVSIMQGIRQGKAMAIVPEDETFTTQAAANYLGMSRQYFVRLLTAGEIAHHRVGSHRRVYFKDLKQYAKKRDKERRAGLSRLFKRLKQEGHYDADVEQDAQ